jgi:hypothetical protein
MKCKICSSEASLAFREEILNKYTSDYYRCGTCGFLFTADPHWLEEAYKSSINLTDTGLVERNLYFRRIVSVLIYFNFDKTARFLDYAGGYGLFTRLMRDTGFDFLWMDPFTQNLLARGFEYSKAPGNEVELLTAFEVFEHLKDPVEEFEKMLSYSDNILISTELLPEALPGRDWWYYGFEHGQHISFYTRQSLKTMAEKKGMRFYSFNGLTLFTKKELKFNTSLLLKLSGYGTFHYVKKKMKSRTWDDHLLLKKQVKL